MRVVIQRVKEASVSIANQVRGRIDHGFLIYLGIGTEDSEEDVLWLCKKISAMRVFSDEEGKMNRDLIEVSGNLLVISQFTLHASTKKGNRPSFTKAARPEQAIPLYEAFLDQMRTLCNGQVASGEFGANMQVASINDGPVTIVIDSQNKE